MASPDIFISYASADVDTARRFADGFTREGFAVWWDSHLHSGEFFDEKIEEALRAAKAVVVLWSPRSANSRWVRAEATLADRNKTLVPAMIAPCDRPIIFELTHTAELAHWDGDPFDRSWQSFLADVRTLVERGRIAATHTAPDIASRARPVAAGRPALAIMPFVNRSGEQADDLLAEGMVEDLIAALSTNRDMKVIASSATLKYRNSAYDLGELGEQLGARYVLEGNIRRVGEAFRVTAQLVDVGNGEILWNRKFDRPLADVAALQEDLVLEVAAHLGVQVGKLEVERALRKPGDLTAWEATLRARALGEQQTMESMQMALEEGRRAVQLAPDFAPAYAALAMAGSGNYWQVPGRRTDEMKQEVLAAAKRARQLDRDNPQVLNAVATALCLVGNWEEGQRCAERAVEINPELEASHAAMVMICNYFNRPAEALEHLDAIHRLAPRGAAAHIRSVQRAGAHFMAGNYEAALAANQEALVHMPDFHFAVKDLVIFHEKLGHREEALAALRSLRAAWPGLTLEHVARMHKGSVLAPEIADQFQELFAAVWQADEERTLVAQTKEDAANGALDASSS